MCTGRGAPAFGCFLLRRLLKKADRTVSLGTFPLLSPCNRWWWGLGVMCLCNTLQQNSTYPFWSNFCGHRPTTCNRRSHFLLCHRLKRKNELNWLVAVVIWQYFLPLLPTSPYLSSPFSFLTLLYPFLTLPYPSLPPLTPPP